MYGNMFHGPELWNTGGGKHVFLRAYIHLEIVIVDFTAAAKWMSYTRFSLPALKPGDFDRSPCPGERERERERARERERESERQRERER